MNYLEIIIRVEAGRNGFLEMRIYFVSENYDRYYVFAMTVLIQNVIV